MTGRVDFPLRNPHAISEVKFILLFLFIFLLILKNWHALHIRQKTHPCGDSDNRQAGRTVLTVGFTTFVDFTPGSIFIKARRPALRYLLMGLPLSRDTERMVLADLSYREGERGYALLPRPTARERRFLARIGFRIIEAGVEDLLAGSDSRVPSSGPKQSA